ncbi:hypothetical protein MLD38_010485 [Melastoma candidum]|uniref:Uncharacterized protein n=1 Tax=Melastoma candidum TaxID=119954 RepID=A0ACB9R3I5_9MYRT|nr:hypothetical protein MLD38_010485 [Melastoma candidum]
MLAQALTASSPPFLPSWRDLRCGLPRRSSLGWGFDGGMGSRATRPRNCPRRVSASQEREAGVAEERKRSIVEHVCLLVAKEDITDEEEKDMLDYLYTTQYQMGGIIATSLGRIANKYSEKYTHAVFMRFQRKEDLSKFYENPFYLKVLEQHVNPYCHGLINVDYESEVHDDMLPIFRKGEEFNYGEELVLLLSVTDDAFGELAEDALAALQGLAADSPSLIVQMTQGFNIHNSDSEYTHGVVIRFRSLEALEIFTGSSEYKKVWRSKFKPIVRKTLTVHFSIDPLWTCHLIESSSYFLWFSPIAVRKKFYKVKARLLQKDLYLQRESSARSFPRSLSLAWRWAELGSKTTIGFKH